MHLNQRHILQFSHELGIQVTPTWHSATKKREEEKKGVFSWVYAVSPVSDRWLLKYFPFLDREISHHFPPFVQKKKKKQLTQSLRYIRKAVGINISFEIMFDGWITNMYTSLHQKHTGGLTSTESNHSRFRYGSAWQHRFSDTPGVILFFSFTPLHHHREHAKRRRPLQLCFNTLLPAKTKWATANGVRCSKVYIRTTLWKAETKKQVSTTEKVWQ